METHTIAWVSPHFCSAERREFVITLKPEQPKADVPREVSAGVLLDDRHSL